MKAAALLIAPLGFSMAQAVARGQETTVIPAPVTAANYVELLERPPFRRHLSLPEALVLSGVARLPDGPVITVWNRGTGESFTVGGQRNLQGWKLVGLTDGPHLKDVSAVISAGGQEITLRFDPNRLTPPKLDNKSKPGAKVEGTVVVEALLRALNPSAAKQFEALPAEAQETFRKAFTGFLSSYPDAEEEERVAFIRRALDEARASIAEEKENAPGFDSENTGEPPPPAGSPVPPPPPSAEPE